MTDECPAWTRNLYCLLQGSETTAKDRVGRGLSAREREKVCEMSSEQDIDISITKSQKLWMPELVLHKNRSINSQAWMAQGLESGEATLTSELFAVDKFREKGNHCFYLCTH